MESLVYLGRWVSIILFCDAWSDPLRRTVLKRRHKHPRTILSIFGGRKDRAAAVRVRFADLRRAINDHPDHGVSFSTHLACFVHRQSIYLASATCRINPRGAAVILSFIWFPLGQLAAWVAFPFVAYSIRIVELFDRVPHGTIFLGAFSIWFVILFYAALFGLTFGGARLQAWVRAVQARARAVGVGSAIVALMLALSLAWRALSAAPDQLLHLTFLNVGSADAIFIKTPGGDSILINGGASATILSDELGRRLSMFNRRLDWLVIANTQEEQLAALPRVIERYPPAQVLWSGNRQGSFSSRKLNEDLTSQAIPVSLAETNQTLDLGNGATLTVLTTGSRGAVLLLEWKNFRALLPVGMSFDALDELQNGASVGLVSVLSLADAGYAPSNPPEWIANLNPELIALSVAADDLNGMPDERTLKLVKDYSLARTDQNGWIEIITNGEQMWVNVEKARK